MRRWVAPVTKDVPIERVPWIDIAGIIVCITAININTVHELRVGKDRIRPA